MIEFKGIRKTFKNTDVLKEISFKIDRGKLVVLVGPSGCGKTTSLKMINKLILPTAGSIYVDGRDIKEQNTIELRRNIGYVIQQTGLFPHMTIGANIGLVPQLKKWNKDTIKKRTIELMELIGMKPEEYINRYPGELSGGQQQRIGVARAFAADSEIILMDEPFSALDPITRGQLQDELFNLQQQFRKTIVFVTHDMDEALKLGEKICIMKDGNILQYDTPETILKSPSHGFVEEFIGRNRIWTQPEYIRARDIMIRQPVTCSGGRTMFQGMEIMKSNNVDSLLVIDNNGKLQGIINSNSIRKSSDKTLKLVEIMDRHFEVVNEKDSMISVLKKMNFEDIGYLPVVDESSILKGLITRSSLLNILGRQYIEEGEVVNE